MFRRLATLTLGLLTTGICWAEDPVVRVQSIKAADGSGKPTLFQKRPQDSKPFPVTINTTGYIKDHYITDQNTVAALEFLIGGRVGINKNTDIEIVNERSVADGKTPVKRVILKNGALWVKADSAKMKERMEIQTNGGVMGIKGTEFTVETNTEGATQVSCFESSSSIGGVELYDNSGKLVGVAKPGDEYILSLKQAPVVKHYDNVEEFRSNKLNSAEFREMTNILTSVMGHFGAYIPYGGYQAMYGLGLAERLVNDPANTVADLAIAEASRHSPVSLGPFGGMIRNSARSSPPKPDFPHEVSPDASTKSVGERETGPHPSFRWKGVDDADGYVVMLSQDENCDVVLFSERTSGNSVSYGSDKRPLQPGQYYWRVIPVDREDRPVKKASQTYFTVR